MSSAHPVGTSAIQAAASSAERTADWEVVYTTYSRLFEAALDEAALELAADALRGMSRACQHRRRLDEAEELALLSFEIAERAQAEKAAARAINTLAVIRYLAHDADAARQLYFEAMTRAIDCGDDALVGWSCQNLGVLSNLGGDLREARALYLESVAASVRSEDPTTAVTAYNSLGLISADLEDWIDSLLYFDRGLEVADEVGDISVRATLLTNRAEPLIAVNELDRALESLEEAEFLTLQIGDQRTLSEIHRFRGRVARMQGDFAAAEEQLDRARRIAEREGLTLEEAEAMEELARVRWQQGRAGAGRILAREALRQYEAVGAEQNAAGLRRLLAEEAGGLPQPRAAGSALEV